MSEEYNLNNLNISTGATLTRGKIFQPTMMLRFVERTVPEWRASTVVSKVRVLQQLWADMNSTETEWRDVPLEAEDE